MSIHPPTLKQLVESLPFVKNHSIAITDMGQGSCRLRMPFDPQFSSPPGIFPAAMVGMLGDVAGITACISRLDPGQVCSTMDFTVKMTGVARGDTLEAEAQALSVGKTVAIGQSRIYAIQGQERTACAVVLVTGRIMGNE